MFNYTAYLSTRRPSINILIVLVIVSININVNKIGHVPMIYFACIIIWAAGRPCCYIDCVHRFK